jgi:hypothetical protein
MPTFIGASTVYGSSSSWPSSLTFGTSDTPAGVVAGDRLVMFVTVRYGQRTFPLPVDKTLASFGGFTGWDYIATAQFSASGGVSSSFTQVWVYTKRFVSGDLPLTATPLDGSSTAYTPILTGGVYRLTLAAWRPSYAWSGLTAARSLGTAFNNATTLPSGAMSGVTGVSAGVFVQGFFLSDSDLGAKSGGAFTTRYTQASIANRGGSFTIADETFSSTTTSSGTSYTKPTGPDGAVILIALDQLDPALGTGWSVGQIKY